MEPSPSISSVFKICLATEDDCSALSSITTAAFSATDQAYPLIWGSVGDKVHDDIARMGIFTPVQKPGRMTYTAVEAATNRVVGFATWTMLAEKKEEAVDRSGGVPDIPGVHMELWRWKLTSGRAAWASKMDRSKDMSLAMFFVHPSFQRRGIGSLLLADGIEKAEKLRAKIWLTSTPHARRTYEKHGWRVESTSEIDLEKYGGKGIYYRYVMVREPAEPVASP